MPTAFYGSRTAKALARSNQRRMNHDAFVLGHQIVQQDKAEQHWNTPPPYYPPTNNPELQTYLTLGQAIRKERKLPDAQIDVMQKLRQQRLKMRTNMGWQKKPRILRNVAQSKQASLDAEHSANTKGINGTQSDGWTDAHTRTEKSGKVTLIKAYRTPYAVRERSYAKAQRSMLIRRNPVDAMAA